MDIEITPEIYAQIAYHHASRATNDSLYATIKPLSERKLESVKRRFELAKKYEKRAEGRLNGTNGSNASRAKQYEWNMGWLELVLDSAKINSSN